MERENAEAKSTEVKIEVRKLDKIEATGHVSKPIPAVRPVSPDGARGARGHARARSRCHEWSRSGMHAPMIKTGHQPTLRPDGAIWIGRAIYSLASELVDHSGLVWPLCGLLDGSRSTAEITATMEREHQASKGQAPEILDLMLSHGWLVDAAAEIPPELPSSRARPAAAPAFPPRCAPRSARSASRRRRSTTETFIRSSRRRPR